jgi:hypothetical protein
MPIMAVIEKLIDNVRDFGLETVFGRYYSCYRGIVIDNIDPDKEGKIIARVPMITGNSDLGEWCYPKACVAGDGFGIFHPPDIGSGVWVEFENGQLDAPLYSGGWWATIDGTLELPSDLQQQAATEPPTAYGWYTSTGHHLFFETKTDNEQVRLGWHRPGDDKYSYVSIDSDGSVQMQNHQGTFVKLNAKDGQEGVTVMDKHGNVISTTETSVQCVHSKGALVELKEGVATLMADEVVLSGQGLNVSTGGCTLGNGATEPVVLGNKLLALWTQAVTAFTAHTHPTSAPGSPTGPPTGLPWPTYTPDTNSLKNKGV